MYKDPYQLNGQFYNIQYYIVEAENNKLFNQCAYNLRIKVYRTNFTVLHHEYELPLTISPETGLIFKDESFDLSFVMDNYDDSLIYEVDIPFTTEIKPDACCNIAPFLRTRIGILFKGISKYILLTILLPEYIGFSIINPQFEDMDTTSYDINLKVTDWGNLPLTGVTNNDYYSTDRWSKNYNGYELSETPYSIDFQTTLESENNQNRFEFIKELKRKFNMYKGYLNTNSDCTILNSETYQFLINFDWYQNLWYPCTIEDIVDVKSKGSYIEGTIKFNLINSYGVRKIIEQVTNHGIIDNVKPIKPLLYVYFTLSNYLSVDYFTIIERITNRTFKINMDCIKAVVKKKYIILRIDMSCKTVDVASFDSIETKFAYDMPLVKDYEYHDGNHVIKNFAGLYRGSQGKYYSTKINYHGAYHKLGNTTDGNYINNNIQALKKKYKGGHLYEWRYDIDFPNDHDTSQIIQMTNDSKIIQPVAHGGSIELKPSKLSIKLTHSTTDYIRLSNSCVPDDSDWLLCYNNFNLSLRGEGSIYVEYHGKN
jgi:hypothetical protein